jgi:hypothetical protein
MPAESGSELQPEMGVPLSLNVTVPVGVPALPVRDAVKMTVWPGVEGLWSDAMLNIATAAFTVWVNVPDVLAR